MTQNQEVNPEPSSNEETRAISLSSELAEWVKLLRAQWMEPVNSGWGQGKRFLMALAGSVTFFVIVIPALKENLPLFVVTEPIILPSVVFHLSLLFAWLGSWKDGGYSPMRLYFSGLTPPAIVALIVKEVLSVSEKTGISP
ncbi:MAG: hypothetical protein OXB94_10735 [Nitrospira sp.]|nr:hypothetical protein [Nitrospira sp.]